MRKASAATWRPSLPMRASSWTAWTSPSSIRSAASAGDRHRPDESGAHLALDRGTMTELNDHLKLLFARAGSLFCECCGKPVRSDSAQSIFEDMQRRAGAAGIRACCCAFRYRCCATSANRRCVNCWPARATAASLNRCARHRRAACKQRTAQAAEEKHGHAQNQGERRQAG